MPLIIDKKTAADDSWIRIESEEQLTLSGDRLVDWALFQAHADQFLSGAGKLGVRIDGDVELDDLAPYLNKLAMVAVTFPTFADGRGFSQARVLRQRYGFAGEVRAVGDVTWDRLRYMARCGINAFDVPADRYSDDMLRAFDEIAVCYQGAEDDPRPIYRQ